MLGAVAVIVLILPKLGAELTLPAPLWLIAIAGMVQNGLLLWLAVLGRRGTLAGGWVPSTDVRSRSGG